MHVIPRALPLQMALALLALMMSVRVHDALPLVREHELRRAGNRRLSELPPYKRGKGSYEWILSPRDRENGISFLGSHERLRVAMDKLRRGKRIHVTTLGGSITAGEGCEDALSWPQYLLNYMNDSYASNFHLHNGAVRGIVSTYMSACHNMHASKEEDIVFVEFSVNDPTVEGFHPFQNEYRRSFERLLRKLLNYPNHPAVVLVNTYAWFLQQPRVGTFWSNVEREFKEFALYYHLPSLSLKSAAFHKMLSGEEGFQVGTTRNENPQELKGKSFYNDFIHPDGISGARVLAELVIHLLEKVSAEVERSPVGEAEAQSVSQEKLPWPMIPNNFESAVDKCFIGRQFTSTVKEHDGWEWINESETARPKWGFVSTTVGSVIKMLVNTRASTTTDASVKVLVELVHLRSYRHMGNAQVTCEGDCSCDPSIIQGHTLVKASLLHIHQHYVTQGEKCIIAVTVLDESQSGEHKVKIAGIIISEEHGTSRPESLRAAVESVNDFSHKAQDGRFDANIRDSILL